MTIIKASDYKEVEGGIGFTNDALNQVFGGSIPVGRVVEMYGDWSTGKTLMCYDLLVSAQKEKAYTLLAETEGAFTKDFAVRCGLDLSNLGLIIPEKDKPVTAGEFFKSAEETMDNNLGKYPFTVVAVDSLTGLNSQFRTADGIDSYDKQYVGDIPRIMSQGLNRLKGLLRPLHGILIIVNQVRDKIGVMFGDKNETPGGRAVKFYSDLRLHLKGKKIWEPKTRPVRGQMGSMYVAKSKLAPPFDTCKFRLIFETTDPEQKLGLDSDYKPRGKDDESDSEG